MSGSEREWRFSSVWNCRYYHDRVRNTFVTERGHSIPATSGATQRPLQELSRVEAAPRHVPTSLQDYVHGDTNDFAASIPGTVTNADRDVRRSAPVPETVDRTRRLSIAPSSASTQQPLDRAQPRTVQAGAFGGETADRPGRAYSLSSTGGSGRVATAPTASQAVTLSADGQHRPLDPDYKRRDSPRKFFVEGKVFLTLWTEPAGAPRPSFATIATDRQITVGKFGEKSYSGVRRFVVIREGEQSCTALPIRSYSGHGAAHRRDQADNGIVYTGKSAPRTPATEPNLLPIAIRVDPDDRDDKLDALSRINYSTVCTIEHNLKVKPYGVVNRDHIRPLMQQFRQVFVSKIGLRGEQADGDSTSFALPMRSLQRTAGSSAQPRPFRTAEEDDIARHIAVANAVERGRDSRARLQGIADKPRGKDPRRSSDAQEDGPSQLAELTSDERQQLRSIFSRAMEVLTSTRGYSAADAQAEATKIVSTEVAKMLSNARDRSRAAETRRPSSNDPSATLGVGTSARTSSTQLPGIAPNAVNNASRAYPPQVRFVAPQPTPTLPLRTSSIPGASSQYTIPSLQTTSRAKDPVRVATPQPRIPSVEDLIKSGWKEGEATALRRLMMDGWAASSATTIITLLRNNVQPPEAKRIAQIMEEDENLSLEDAVRRFKQTRLH